MMITTIMDKGGDWSMRFLVIAHMPTEAGNKAIKDPNMAKNLEDYVNSVKAEAAYFTEVDGERSFFFVVDMQSADMMVATCEPLFQVFNARVEVKLVMTLEDVKKGMQTLSK
jgi:hypothetical protein